MRHAIAFKTGESAPLRQSPDGESGEEARRIQSAPPQGRRRGRRRGRRGNGLWSQLTRWKMGRPALQRECWKPFLDCARRALGGLFSLGLEELPPRRPSLRWFLVAHQCWRPLGEASCSNSTAAAPSPTPRAHGVFRAFSTS